MRRALALAVGLTFVLAACGNKASPKATLLAASTKTVGGQTARMALDVKINAKQGSPTEITGAGVTDLTKHTGSLDLKLPAFGGQNLGTIQVRVLQKLIYEKLPDTLASAAGIKGWVKIDLDALAKQNGFDINSFTQGQSSDPTQFLDLLKTVSDDVKEVGKEKVRGTDTTHYTATVDLGKALATNQQLDATAKTNLGDLYKNLTALANVWIDGSQRDDRPLHPHRRPRPRLAPEHRRRWAEVHVGVDLTRWVRRSNDDDPQGAGAVHAERQLQFDVGGAAGSRDQHQVRRHAVWEPARQVPEQLLGCRQQPAHSHDGDVHGRKERRRAAAGPVGRHHDRTGEGDAVGGAGHAQVDRRARQRAVGRAHLDAA
jgi:hypothetical protein